MSRPYILANLKSNSDYWSVCSQTVLLQAWQFHKRITGLLNPAASATRCGQRCSPWKLNDARRPQVGHSATRSAV
jgi:hypothetical protein